MRNIGLSIGIVAALSGTDAIAQDAEYLDFIEALADIAVPRDYTSIQGVPTAGVAPAGYGFVAGAIISNSVGSTNGGMVSGPLAGVDASMTLGFGVGAIGDVDTQFSMNITSVDPRNFADSGSLGFKFGTQFDTSDTPINASLAFDNLAGWGDASTSKISTTLAVSSSARRFYEGGDISYAWSAGYKSYQGGEAGPFAGLSIGLSKMMSVSTAYEGVTDVVTLGLGVKLTDQAFLSITSNDPFNMGAPQGVTASVSFLSELF